MRSRDFATRAISSLVACELAIRVRNASASRTRTSSEVFAFTVVVAGTQGVERALRAGRVALDDQCLALRDDEEPIRSLPLAHDDRAWREREDLHAARGLGHGLARSLREGALHVLELFDVALGVQ